MDDIELPSGCTRLRGPSGTVLVRAVEMPSFREDVAFFNQVAAIAERLDHHP